MKTKIKRGKNRPLLVCSISLIFFLAIASVATAASVVSVQPPTQDAAPGDTFSINVNVDSGSDNLQSAHVELNFDTSKLVANTLTPGTLLGTGTAILEEPGNGIGTGKVTYGVARTSGNPAVPVNGTLFTVQFTVKSSAPAGVSALDLANVELMKSVSSPIASPTVNDGQVNVTGETPPQIGSAKVWVVPQTQDAAPGNTFSINVNVDSGSDNLQAAHVELNFDTSKLVANTLTPGTLLGTGTAILEEPGNGIGTGKVTYGVARTSGNPAVPVNGTLFTVQFTVKSSAPAGVSALDLANVELMKSASSPIANPTVNDGQVNVEIPPTQSGDRSWRFISVPYVLNDSSVVNALSGIDYTMLFAWDPVGKNPISPVTQLEPLHGYLIYMNTTQQIPDLERKSGPIVPPSMDIIKGWNLIGTPGNVTLDAETMLMPIDGSYFSIWNWNISQQGYDEIGINGKTGVITPPPPITIEGTDVFTLHPKVSYWVWATQNDTLPAFSP